MTYAQIGRFYLTSVIKINPQRLQAHGDVSDAFEEKDVDYGFALEVNCGLYEGKDNHIVIAFFKPNKEHELELESVGKRFFDYVQDGHDLEDVKTLFNYAQRLHTDWAEEHDEF